MSVVIPDDIVEATRMTEDELRQEIAVLLFQKEKLTLAQASRLAGMTRLQFQHLLASREIPVHYDVGEFERDLAALQEMGRLPPSQRSTGSSASGPWACSSRPSTEVWLQR